MAGPADDSYSLPPVPAGLVMHIRDFVADLARASKGYLENKETMETVYGDEVLKKMAIYAIIKKMKMEKQTMTSAISMAKKPCGLRLSSPLLPPPLKKTAG